MRIDSIKLIQFRQFDEFYAQDFHDRLNVIVGKNAQGKTTVLEAISFLTQLKSFRAGHNRELIQENTYEASILAEISKPTHSQVLISFEERKKSIKIDNKKISSVAKYPFYGTSVSFVPDDLYLVKGGPDQRRNFFDELTLAVEPKAVSTYQQFQKILKQRNRVLKGLKNLEPWQDQLELWTDQYIEASIRVYKERVSCLEKVNELFPQLYRELFQKTENVEIEYETGYPQRVPSQSEMQERLDRLAEAEKAVGYTLTGPHRDDFHFQISGLIARSYASQGQTRSFVIALKLTQLELIRKTRSIAPILLLDDIISELDDSRVQSLVSFLSDYPGQLFVSTAEQNKLKTLHEQFSSFHLVDLVKPDESTKIFSQSKTAENVI